MKTIDIASGPQQVPVLIQGCMRMPSLSPAQAAEVIRTSYDAGIRYFDHADIYGAGEAERRFAEAFPLTGLRRDEILLQSKCAICPERGEIDWSREHILKSVDGILSRLGTDYLDVLLLHRPDLLFEPDEVAEAFDTLERSGKVRYFGVSNLIGIQLQLLQKSVRQKLIIDQMQFSLVQSQLIDHAFYMNNSTTDRAYSQDCGVLDYCRLNGITVQAWSPLQHGMFGGNFVDNPDYPELNKVLAELAESYGVSKTAIALAWVLRHPAKMQALVGSMNPAHIRDAAQAADITLSHHDWYRLYLASGKFLP